MPRGTGTYGSKKGRPPKKKSAMKSGSKMTMMKMKMKKMGRK